MAVLLLLLRAVRTAPRAVVVVLCGSCVGTRGVGMRVAVRACAGQVSGCALLLSRLFVRANFYSFFTTGGGSATNGTVRSVAPLHSWTYPRPTWW